MPTLKNIITPELREQVQILFDRGFGSRIIAKKLGITRDFVQKIYKLIGVYNIGRKTPRRVHMQTEKLCKQCGIIKLINFFRIRIGEYADGTQRISYEPYCIDCEYIRNVRRNENNKQIRKKSKEERIKNNPPKTKEGWRIYHNEYNKTRRKSDPAFNLRHLINAHVNIMLKQKHGSKSGKSIMKFLPYTIEQLLQHLESQFEPWMTWANHGNYDPKTWDDNDSSTWTWQIDHIIPQSDLPYDTMDHPNFIKCWSLSNLRPLSAKKNQFEGVHRIRHKKT